MKTPRSRVSLEVPSLRVWFYCLAGVVASGAGSVAVQRRGTSWELKAQILRLLIRATVCINIQQASSDLWS